MNNIRSIDRIRSEGNSTRKHPPYADGSGFSILEVLTALSILTIGILAVIQMEIISQRNITSGNIVTLASLLAQTEIERIREDEDVVDLKNRFTVDPDPHDPFQVAYAFVDPLAGLGADSGGANCETAQFDGSGSCLATVTVSWRRGGGGRGGSGSVRLQTLVREGRS